MIYDPTVRALCIKMNLLIREVRKCVVAHVYVVVIVLFVPYMLLTFCIIMKVLYIYITYYIIYITISKAVTRSANVLVGWRSFVSTLFCDHLRIRKKS